MIDFLNRDYAFFWKSFSLFSIFCDVKETLLWNHQSSVKRCAHWRSNFWFSFFQLNHTFLSLKTRRMISTEKDTASWENKQIYFYIQWDYLKTESQGKKSLLLRTSVKVTLRCCAVLISPLIHHPVEGWQFSKDFQWIFHFYLFFSLTSSLLWAVISWLYPNWFICDKRNVSSPAATKVF